jgi:tRNA modification GTPase
MIRSALDDTIAALATPPGTGALAVVRLSGAGAIALAARVFAGERDLHTLGGFQAAHGWIRDADGPVDEVVVWIYRAPRSYTGEDMVEISCHGGAVPARRVLEALWREGARPGDPGEFTRRAFLNGRIDLAQAEAVADLIAARGRRAQEQALVQLEGGLSRRVRALAGSLRDILAGVEAHLDFGEDVPVAPDSDRMQAQLLSLETELSRLYATHAPSRRLREGMLIALVGRPNVGKSSLLNALAGTDRALVHPLPGTTRDVVDVAVEWSGLPVRLVDTAGLRARPGDPVEEAGIALARREVARADLYLWVVDGSVAADPEDLDVGEHLDASRVHLVLNKRDLGIGAHAWWVSNYSPKGFHLVSALTGEGVSDLQQVLEREAAGDLGTDPETIWVGNERHARLLLDARDALARSIRIFQSGGPLELGAADFHRALDALAAITGDEAGDDLLDAVFTRFCIGK